MMRAPRFWEANLDPRSREAAPVTRWLLSPLAALYAHATERRIRKADPLRLSIPVICVGNISAGGTGKSPVAAALRDHLKQQFPDTRIATLSRGYGGQVRQALKVDFETHTAADTGDESLMLARTGEAWIGPDRAVAGKAMQDDGVGLIIMDDGHQNPGLHKDLSIVVVDSDAGFGNGFVIPKGPLREPVETGLARADAVIIVGPSDAPDALSGFNGPILRTHITPTTTPVAQTYVAFAGIGRPEKFFDTLTQTGNGPADAVPFADHHVYTSRDLAYLRSLAAQYDATLITTEKDFVRLRPDQREGIHTLPVKAEFAEPAALDKLLAPVAERLKP